MASSLASWCVGEPMAATIGRRGDPFLVYLRQAIDLIHLTFLIRCRENHITPTGLRVTLPLRAPGVHRIIRRTELALLRLLIREVRCKKVKSEESGVLGEEIRTLVNAEQWNRLKAWCSSTMEKISLDTKANRFRSMIAYRPNNT